MSSQAGRACLAAARLKCRVSTTVFMSTMELARQSVSFLETIYSVFKERPKCKFCNRELSICSHSNASLVHGIEVDYLIKTKRYKCLRRECSGNDLPYVIPQNGHRGPKKRFDFDIVAKVNHLHFAENMNAGDIQKVMIREHGLEISTNSIGLWIKIYELACAKANPSRFLKEMKKKGVAIICTDVMKPVAKESSELLMNMEYFSGDVFNLERIKSETRVVHADNQAKNKKLMEGHGINVIGIMSDDKKEQRDGVRDIWGNKVLHMSCHWHFYKQFMRPAYDLAHAMKKAIFRGLKTIQPIKVKISGKTDYLHNSKIRDVFNGFIDAIYQIAHWGQTDKDFHLDGIKVYEWLEYIYDSLMTLKQKIKKRCHSKFHYRELPAVKGITKRVHDLLSNWKQDYLDLVECKKHYDIIKKILDNDNENYDKGARKLRKYTKKQKKRQDTQEHMGKAENECIKLIWKFVLDRALLLFNYRRVNERYIAECPEIIEKLKKAKTNKEIEEIQKQIYVPKVNMKIESLFKTKKSYLKRVLGQANPMKYLLNHGSEIFFVRNDESLGGIREILKNADYSAIMEELMLKKFSRKNLLKRMKDPEESKIVKQELDALLAEALEIIEKESKKP